jgi:thymidylate synthase
MISYEFEDAQDACRKLMFAINQEGNKIEAANKKQSNEAYKEELVELENVVYEIKDSSKMLLPFKNLHCTPWWIVSETLSEVLALHPHITQKYAPKTFEWAYKLPVSKIPRYSYGGRWAENNSLLNTFLRLKENPTSKRAVVPIFNGSDTDLGSSDVPCTLLHRYSIRDGKLNVNVIWRSHDVYSGLFKVDLHLAYFLQNMMISWLNSEGNQYEPGTITGMDFSLHYYPKKNEEQMKKLLTEMREVEDKDIYQNDKIVFPVLSIDEFYKELNRCRYVEEVSYGAGFEWCFNKIKDMKSAFFRDWARIMVLKNAKTHKNIEAYNKAYNEIEFVVNKRWVDLYEQENTKM